jgi:hypothetical protein
MKIGFEEYSQWKMKGGHVSPSVTASSLAG